MHAHARSCHRADLQARDLVHGDDVDNSEPVRQPQVRALQRLPLAVGGLLGYYDARRAERTTASTNMEWCIRDASQIEVTGVEKVWVTECFSIAHPVIHAKKIP